MASIFGSEKQRISPFLWFNGNVNEAVKFYTSVFEGSEVLNVHRMPADVPGQDSKIMTAVIRLYGMEFMLLDGGPMFNFTEAISFFVHCDNQQEVDKLWDSLTADGGKESRCGWLKDKYGVSWQIIPNDLGRLMGDPDRAKAGKVMNAMMKMSKIIVKELEDAYNG